MIVAADEVRADLMVEERGEARLAVRLLYMLLNRVCAEDSNTRSSCGRFSTHASSESMLSDVSALHGASHVELERVRRHG